MRTTFRFACLLGVLLTGGPALAQQDAQSGPLGLFSLGSFSAPRARQDTSPPAAPAGGAPKEPQRIVTRLATFGIPIVAPAVPEGVKEIQLHVSADLGKTWHLYYRVAPTEKFFPFKAAADGEYWFATRMIDARHSAAAEGDLRPEMKVVIDTTPPRLLLSAEFTESGEIRAAWRATDPLLAPQSLKLEYQTSANGPWRSIAIPAGAANQEEGALVGAVSWRPREASRVVQLRAEIHDQAGNHAVAVDRLVEGESSAALAKDTKPLGPPIAGPAAPPAEEPKKEGAFSAVTKWIGGAFGSGGESRTSPPADPYASSSPSDAGVTDRSMERSPSINWSSPNAEFTKEGVRRSVQPERSVAGSTPAPETPRVTQERRGPGRLASASTVREPSQRAEEESPEGEVRRPAILPPENAASRNAASPEEDERNWLPEGVEPEEIPPPPEVQKAPPASPSRREEPRRDDRSREEMPREEPNWDEEEAPAPRSEFNRGELSRGEQSRAVESLPDENVRKPIPSAPRRRPEEFRQRGPIPSGVTGSARGPVRPPATPSYRNASTGRDVEESPVDYASRIPAGADPIFTRHLRFALEYDVTAVGPGGVADVELWATRDGGANWSRWGTDPDRRSPFEVEVDGEGAYGFRIVVLSRGGLASRPPQPGDEADQWVVVDSTPPQLVLRGAAYGVEERVGQLEITWDARDPNLTERSVTLFYSDQPEGPWTKIVGDLANQGVYYWRVDSRIPPRVYIKVEVRDAAGNISTDRTLEPIRIEGLTPSGKIRRIVPLEDARE